MDSFYKEEFMDAAATLQAAGGRQGLDCVLAVLFRVFVVNVQGHAVIFFLRPLSKTTPTAEMNHRVLPDLTR
jgi:hypothetical protein